MSYSAQPVASQEVPETVAGLALWYDVATLDPLQNNDNIELIEDKGPNGLHATWDGTNPGAFYLNDAGDGHPAADFPGDRGFLVAGATDLLRNVPGGTIFVVNRWRGSGVSTILHISANIGTTDERLRHRRASGGEWSFDANPDDTDSNADPKFLAGAAGSDWHTFTARADYVGREVLMRRDGNVERLETDPYWTSGNSVDTASLRTRFACRSLTSQLFDGQFRELIVYERALTDAEVQEVEDYLSVKWFPQPQLYRYDLRYRKVTA